jgi:hypothetical protein
MNNPYFNTLGSTPFEVRNMLKLGFGSYKIMTRATIERERHADFSKDPES